MGVERSAASPSPETAWAHLDRSLRVLLGRPGSLPCRGLLSVSAAMPEWASLTLAPPPLSGCLWAGAGGERRLLGWQRAELIRASGSARLQHLERAFHNLSRHWTRLAEPGLETSRACALVGFAFDPHQPGRERSARAVFPNACLLIPGLLLEWRAGSCTLTFSHRCAPAMDPDRLRLRWLRAARRLLHEATHAAQPAAASSAAPIRRATTPDAAQWANRVKQALEAIAAGRLEKVVVSRRLRLDTGVPVAPARVAAWLDNHHPDCTRYSCSSGPVTLVGASPERLVALHNGRVVADAVAGTVPRGRSDDPCERRDGRLVLKDAKYRTEQSLVVRALLDGLAPLCRTLEVPEQPRCLELAHVRHLWTPVQGRAYPGIGLLRLAEALHPTPAVAGMPRAEAMDWLARHDDPERGWYSGAFGWLDADGGGELAVLLRFARLHGRVAELHAGAGIVAGSDPRAEWLETEWKLRTMLDALTGG
jgi:isochorismate synthase